MSEFSPDSIKTAELVVSADVYLQGKTETPLPLNEQEKDILLNYEGAKFECARWFLNIIDRPVMLVYLLDTRTKEFNITDKRENPTGTNIVVVATESEPKLVYTVGLDVGQEAYLIRRRMRDNDSDSHLEEILGQARTTILKSEKDSKIPEKEWEFKDKYFSMSADTYLAYVGYRALRIQDLAQPSLLWRFILGLERRLTENGDQILHRRTEGRSFEDLEKLTTALIQASNTLQNALNNP